ncbi:nucleotidyltransferase family protein [Pseudarthrobacter sp. AG30]|uniref:nucleotidyltransferase family protein n=1 Tax=Pseudarthrobacter sp. AG30 TaxID=2249742 RepID=UPI000D651523|nr:nucleotidyltransferase family protein [Pseudarthrobacter sp. AG30]RAX17324.1 nucleotidyltransferase family protein [Pseudarthrobacter sp. AG30]
MENIEESGGPGVRVTGVLLAAGAGTRLGLGPKALLPYRGRPLVEVLAGKLLKGGCREVVVVVGAGASEVQAAAALACCRVVVNPEWQSGMGSSFLLGNNTADPEDHLLIALVDQPGLTPEIVRRLLAAHHPGRITAAAYRGPESDGGQLGGLPDAGSPLGGSPDTHSPDGSAGHDGNRGQSWELRRGHPLLIDGSLRPSVAATVTGDAGARIFLRTHPELVDEVDCSDQSSGEDIDTPDQLRLLR